LSNVLIAVHDETLRHLLGTALRRFKHDVRMSVNGEHVQSLIRGGEFDLVLLDEHIQDSTALDILRQLGPAGCSASRIMVLSSKSSKDIIRIHVDAGATYFVVKPLSLPKLILRIEMLLEEKRRAWRTWSSGDVLSDSAPPLAAAPPNIT
jgi:DNA-binding response OmpR family regulator